jgi:hypothetical protein
MSLATVVLGACRNVAATKHYAYEVWFSFGTQDDLGPPCGVPPRPGDGGGSFGRQKYLMGSPTVVAIFGAPFRCALGCGHQPRSRACLVRSISFAALSRSCG